ncbi:calmodulin regulator protein PCP4 [Indicator indicator]|uniref:calmodulin regulator protein PCP4 n=1 Tax=Indicator indicator TaxID=1002788 RepID=UPI0023DE7BF0|nr:calmodulin regulator protein PCP4 [Indicator indicator]
MSEVSGAGAGGGRAASAAAGSGRSPSECHHLTGVWTAPGRRQGAGATNGKDKTSGENDGQKKVQEEFDIDMDAPETERAAVAIQSQFRKFQKKKAGSQS